MIDKNGRQKMAQEALIGIGCMIVAFGVMVWMMVRG